MHWKLKNFIIGCIFVATTLLPAGQASALTFLDWVIVTSDQVTLADLVSPKSTAPSQWDRIVVSRAPRPGASLTVTGAQIKLGLRNSGIKPEDLDTEIPLRVELERPGQVLTADTVRVQFERELRTKLDYPVSEFQIELVGWPDEQIIQPGNVELVITEDPENLRKSLFRSYASFTYELLVDEKVVDSGRARVRITAKTKVPVVVRDLQRNTVLTRADLEYQEVDLTRVNANTYTSIEEVLGYRTTRLVRRGLPLNRQDLEVPPLVLYNSRVRLIANFNGVVVETVGKALMDGALGEIIRVENVATGRVIGAEVVGAGCVQAVL